MPIKSKKRSWYSPRTFPAARPKNLCKERFLRSLGLVKKARDLALDVIREVSGEPQAPGSEGAAKHDGTPAERLSAEDQAMIDAAVGGTTGVAKPVLRAPIRLR